MKIVLFVANLILVAIAFLGVTHGVTAEISILERVFAIGSAVLAVCVGYLLDNRTRMKRKHDLLQKVGTARHLLMLAVVNALKGDNFNLQNTLAAIQTHLRRNGITAEEAYGIFFFDLLYPKSKQTTGIDAIESVLYHIAYSAKARRLLSAILNECEERDVRETARLYYIELEKARMTVAQLLSIADENALKPEIDAAIKKGCLVRATILLKKIRSRTGDPYIEDVDDFHKCLETAGVTPSDFGVREDDYSWLKKQPE